MAGGGLKTRRAGSNKRWNEETRMGVTESGNRVTSRQNEDPGRDPGPSDPGQRTVLPSDTNTHFLCLEFGEVQIVQYFLKITYDRVLKLKL